MTFREYCSTSIISSDDIIFNYRQWYYYYRHYYRYIEMFRLWLYVISPVLKISSFQGRNKLSIRRRSLDYMSGHRI